MCPAHMIPQRSVATTENSVKLCGMWPMQPSSSCKLNEISHLRNYPFAVLLSYYVMTLAPIGPRELKHKTSGIRHIVRSCCHIVLVALLNKELRVLFFKKIQDSKNFFTRCVKVTDRRIHSGSGLSGSIAHHDPNDLGMICLVKKRKIHFWILSDLRIQSWIFLKSAKAIL